MGESGQQMPRQTEAILDLIYLAALSADRWPDALTGVCAATGYASGCLIMDGGSGRRPVFHATRRTERALADFIAAGLFNSCARRLRAVGHDGFAHESAFPPAVARRPAVETLRRLGLWDQTATQHCTGDVRRFVFTFEREADEPGFSPQAVRLLDWLRPHLLRSAALGMQDGQCRQGAAAGGTLPGALTVPAVLITASGRVFEANAAAATHRPPLLDAAQTRLCLAEWQDAAAVLARVERAARAGHGLDLSLPPRNPALPSCRLQAVPTRWRGRPVLLVTVQPICLDATGCDPSALMQDLGLTRREAEVAARLAAGQSLSDTAAGLAMSRETARHHLKQIFQKTDTHRQAELVARIFAAR